MLALSAFGVLSVGVAGCGDSPCAGVLAYEVDEAVYCLRPPVPITELQVCGPLSDGRPRVVCLVDGMGRLYISAAGRAARLSGAGWRHTDAVGDQGLTEQELQRYENARSYIGAPAPGSECPP
jgi:hypothetical protein